VIRFQEKVSEKVNKFVHLNQNTFNIIVVDCHNLHSGAFDDEDLRNALYGASKEPAYQDYFQGKKIFGLLKKNNIHRGAQSFREKISALLCIKKIKLDLLAQGNVYLACNDLLHSDHMSALMAFFKKSGIITR